jgi:hypothetical protein
MAASLAVTILLSALLIPMTKPITHHLLLASHMANLFPMELLVLT